MVNSEASLLWSAANRATGRKIAGPWEECPAEGEDRVKSDRYLHSPSSLSTLLRDAGFREVSVKGDEKSIPKSSSDGMRVYIDCTK